MLKTEFKTIDFADDFLVLIDQTALPLNEDYIKTDDYERIAVAIERLEVRGAPAIGIAAAYAVALAFKKKSQKDSSYFIQVYERLAATRPTAVNLFWALDEMKKVFVGSENNIYSSLLKRAKEIHTEDIRMCEGMGENGIPIFNKKMNVLTHCNTGQLATGGGGTAFNVIRYAFNSGLVNKVFADETRPLLQGSRLTAFELEKAGIPFEIITDSTAAMLMKQGKVDLVITGADRIALNGDAANKIGTYSLAVIANYHKIPFYIAAPTSTIDSNCFSGEEIKIEERGKAEIISINGNLITKPEYQVYSPAFDVTPNELISGIITEKGIHRQPFKFDD